jgi:hypothetical protein
VSVIHANPSPAFIAIHSIRNYMSKPWFLKIALEGEPTPLRQMIGKILEKDAKAAIQAHVDQETKSVDEGIVAITRATEVARL